MNVKSILAWIPSHIGVLAIGAAVVFFVLYQPLRGTAGKLRTELDNAKSNVAASQSAGGWLAGANIQLQSQLEERDRLLAENDTTIKRQQLELDRQRSLLSQQQSGLANLASQVGSVGSTIEDKARLLASLIDGLYAIYNPSQ